MSVTIKQVVESRREYAREQIEKNKKRAAELCVCAARLANAGDYRNAAKQAEFAANEAGVWAEAIASLITPIEMFIDQEKKP